MRPQDKIGRKTIETARISPNMTTWDHKTKYAARRKEATREKEETTRNLNTNDRIRPQTQRGRKTKETARDFNEMIQKHRPLTRNDPRRYIDHKQKSSQTWDLAQEIVPESAGTVNKLVQIVRQAREMSPKNRDSKRKNGPEIARPGQKNRPRKKVQGPLANGPNRETGPKNGPRKWRDRGQNARTVWQKMSNEMNTHWTPDDKQTSWGTQSNIMTEQNSASMQNVKIS